ncbi:MAG: DUF1611 domain-containing protein [Deltaproteobacteria bacterium]|jgi:uncharacterized NAD-dependent epimerase/dehydratase family protein|nr:DUF1611 domain-containing protein [Deltaproteobacteria bacterium]MBW2534802.1 DUF1611 domain-containing protein [Deltaproteobacteria bacterium]
MNRTDEFTRDGSAIVYCEGAYATTNGKTAHGLVRRTARYRVLSVIDSTQAGEDAGASLDGVHRDIPIVADLKAALEDARARDVEPTHFVIGLAPDGGRLDPTTRAAVLAALQARLHVDAGLHDYLSEDEELVALAALCGAQIRDVRKPPALADLHFWSGKIEEVHSFKVAILGTDSAVGKRTTAWLLCDALEQAGLTSVMVGTGQTAWLQGARYGVVLDSLVNDFVSGEIEHAVWSAWHAERPDVLVLEGQGSLLNPAYPGGFELLAAARPDVVVLQHAPARRDYDGFPGSRLHPLGRQIEAVEIISGRQVVAVALNREGLAAHQVPAIARELRQRVGLPVVDPLGDGARALAELVRHRRDAPPPRATASNGDRHSRPRA